MHGPARVLTALEALARFGAILGGFLLCALAGLTLASIAGRSLLSHPVLGDIELVEIGVATAVFLFLPYCHLSGGNVAVEIFTGRLPGRVQEGLKRLGDLLLAAIAALLVWRMTLGAVEMRLYGEETMMLGLPIWWAFIPAISALSLLGIACLTTALWGRPNEALEDADS